MKTQTQTAIASLRTVAVCLLNKDIRKEFFDNINAATKATLQVAVEESGTWGNIDIQALVVRGVYDNALSTYQMATAYSLNQIKNPLLNQHMVNSRDLILKMTGWTLEEHDALTKPDFTAMRLSEKLQYITAHPKEVSVYSEGMEIVNEFLEPFRNDGKEFMANHMIAIHETIEHISTQENDEFINIDGVVVPLAMKEQYLHTKSPLYHLTTTCGLTEEVAGSFIDPENTRYHLPHEIVELVTMYRENAISQDFLNTQVKSWLLSNTVQFPWH